MVEYSVQELNELAMKIILHAGECRSCIAKAFQSAGEKENSAQVKELLKEAREKITEAHKLQTKVLQDTVMNESQCLTMLFIHAQDTLMTIHSELFMAENVLALYEQTREEEKHA